MSEELDVQIAAETLSTLWKSGSAPGPRTIAVAAAATGVARSSSELLNNISKHPLMSIPAKVYKNSRSYSKSSAAKIKHIMTRKRKPKALNADDLKKPSKFGVRKHWKHFMMSAGFASLSRESRQRLRYCLHLLKLSTKSLAMKVGQLNELVQQERAFHMAQKIAASNLPANKKANIKKRRIIRQTMERLKREIVLTVYKAVAVVSTVAGSSLPEPARSKVKNYILRLPSKWAANLEQPKFGDADLHGSDTPMTEFCTPAESNTSDEEDDNDQDNENDSGLHSAVSRDIFSDTSSKNDLEMGNKVLTLAHESLEMLDQIINVVGQTLERAEMWVDKWKARSRGRQANNASESQNANQEDDSASEYDTADEDVLYEEDDVDEEDDEEDEYGEIVEQEDDEDEDEEHGHVNQGEFIESISQGEGRTTSKASIDVSGENKEISATVNDTQELGTNDPQDTDTNDTLTTPCPRRDQGKSKAKGKAKVSKTVAVY